MSAVEHRFGPYGGQYVPETLMPALAELEAAWVDGARRPRLPRRARRAAARLRRPPVAAVPRRAAQRGRRPRDLPQARGPQPHRRAQDQQRARPGAAGQADGQAADHRRDRRRPARRRHARPRARCSTSSASSTWAPRTCAARQPNVERMGLLGARVEPVEAGSADAEGGRLRGDPRLGHQRRRPPTTSSARASGPRPYPAIVRDLQRVIGDEARAQILERAGPAARAGDRVRRRRLELDRASFTPFVDDAGVRARSASRRRARASRPGATARR